MELGDWPGLCSTFSNPSAFTELEMGPFHHEQVTKASYKGGNSVILVYLSCSWPIKFRDIIAGFNSLNGRTLIADGP
jgi:hypothetical protein